MVNPQPDLKPIPTFRQPVVLLNREHMPVAVLQLPVVVQHMADAPCAALKIPVVLLTRAHMPVAVLQQPVVLQSMA